MTDPTPVGGAASGNRTIMIVLAYLGLLALIPLLVEKQDQEVQWHARARPRAVRRRDRPVCGSRDPDVDRGDDPGDRLAVSLLGCLVWTILPIGILVLHIMCIIKGVNGQRLLIPYVSQYADKF